jgi:hypothetical protein
LGAKLGFSHRKVCEDLKFPTERQGPGTRRFAKDRESLWGLDSGFAGSAAMQPSIFGALLKIARQPKRFRRLSEMIGRIFKELYTDSPKANLAKIRARFTGQPLKPVKVPQQNKVLDDLLRSPDLCTLLVFAIGRGADQRLVFAGAEGVFVDAAAELGKKGRTVACVPWQWSDGAAGLNAEEGARVVLCRLPVTEAEWQTVAALKQRLGGRLTLLTELLLPFTRITFLQGKLDYFLKELGALLPHYLGEKFFGPLDKLDAVFPLRGKSVIEFGPFDGCQTAGLVQLGAASVTCIEARAENAVKTLTAADVFGWSNVRVMMDDFHNADATKYGRFDLAFAHGVYYHSIAPFVFLENLLGLSDRVFLGGFCATDTLPATPWMDLSHGGRTYRAKQYREAGHFTAGVNRMAWHFHAEDLMRFFTERGWKLQMISDEETTVTAGRYVRFLASRG